MPAYSYTGIEKQKVEPLPSTESTQILPPNLFTISDEI